MPKDSSLSVDRYGLSSAPVEREQYVPRIIEVTYTEGSNDQKWSSRDFPWTRKLEVICWVSIFSLSTFHVLMCFLATFRSVTRKCLEITRFDLTREKSSTRQWVALMYLCWCQQEEARVWRIRSLYLRLYFFNVTLFFSKLFSNIFVLQLPALICQGITLVISPLVSLIQDQIMNLLQVNISETPRDFICIFCFIDKLFIQRILSI